MLIHKVKKLALYADSTCNTNRKGLRYIPEINVLETDSTWNFSVNDEGDYPDVSEYWKYLDSSYLPCAQVWCTNRIFKCAYRFEHFKNWLKEMNKIVRRCTI